MLRSTPVDRRLIINADDFGLSPAVNAAIIQAYRAGVLSSASLMVGGDAVDEAVTMARANPGLAIGLHVSFSDVTPMTLVPLLVENGRFPPDERLVHPAIRSPLGRRQIRQEIAAQFAAYRRLDLPLDHVNSHRNVHLYHPFMAFAIIRAAAQEGAPAFRIPWDPPQHGITMGHVLRYIRTVMLRVITRYYGLPTPDRSIGRIWDVAQLVAMFSRLGIGVTEVYCHPIVTNDAHMFAADLASLLDPQTVRALNGVKPVGYHAAIG